MGMIAKQGATCPFYVGMSFYTSDTSFNPETAWPGTKWQRLQGVFLLAASDSHKVGETGGEETHTLTVAEMPTHTHSMNARAYGYSSWGSYKTPGYTVAIDYNTSNYLVPNRTINSVIIGMGCDSDSKGNNQPYNNMPPYTVRVYWERQK